MAEWFNAAVLKTVEDASPPGVRIPLCPPVIFPTKDETMNLYKYVSEKINESLGESVTLEVPKNPEFGDFATNAAMILARKVGLPPRDVANDIVGKINGLDFVAETSVAGPGFINIKLKDEFILRALLMPRDVVSNSLTIDLDYGAYNVAKALHIGHLRTSIVGDTLNRIGRFLGHRMLSWNHMGDWGKPMALVIAWIIKHFPNDWDKPDFEVNASELNDYYPLASALAKSDPDFQALAHTIKADFQDGQPAYTALYEKFLSISLDMMNDAIKKMNILPFDYDLGERNAAQYLDKVEEILNAKNLIQKDDGAEIIVLKTDTDKAPMPPYMWRDSRGADTYDSTDLAAVYCRKITDNPDRMIYFTDLRQSLHFQQLFRVSELSGIFPAERMEHIGYGTINGKDGKPFKTRDGNAAGLVDVMNLVNEAVEKRISESGKSLPTETAEVIALAALKFNDLVHDVHANYVFEPESITQFEGKTGPYILYTAVRLNSILNRAGTDAVKLSEGSQLNSDERALLLTLLDAERVINTAFDKRDTSLLANYTYDLAQLINTFYHNCPILREDVNADTRSHRLAIVKKSLETLSTVIDLMGLRVPESM